MITFTNDLSVFSYADYDRIWARVLGEPQATNTDAPGWVTKIFPAGAQGIFALDGDQVIGFCKVFTNDVRYAWVSDFAIDPTFHRRGIGREMLTWVMDRFSALTIRDHAIKPPPALPYAKTLA